MAKEKETKAIVKQDNNLPDYLQGEVGKGVGEINIREVKLGFLKLMHEKSPEAEANIFEVGHLINSISQVDYGTEINIIPLIVARQATKWIGRDSGAKGVECSTKDLMTGDKYGNCEACEFYFKTFFKVKAEREVQCIYYHNYICSVNDDVLPVIVGFAMNKSTGKAGNTLQANIADNKNQLPMYCFQFKLKVFKDKSGNNSFWNLRIEGNGMVVPEKFPIVKKLSEQLRGIKIDVETPVEDDKAPF